MSVLCSLNDVGTVHSASLPVSTITANIPSVIQHIFTVQAFQSNFLARELPPVHQSEIGRQVLAMVSGSERMSIPMRLWVQHRRKRKRCLTTERGNDEIKAIVHVGKAKEGLRKVCTFPAVHPMGQNMPVQRIGTERREVVEKTRSRMVQWVLGINRQLSTLSPCNVKPSKASSRKQTSAIR